MKKITCPHGQEIAGYKHDEEAQFSELPTKIRDMETGETIRFPVPNAAWGKGLREELFDAAEHFDAEFSVIAERDSFMETSALIVTKFRYGTHHDPVKYWAFSELAALREGDAVYIECPNEDILFHVWTACEEFIDEKRIALGLTPSNEPHAKPFTICAERMKPGQRTPSALTLVREEIKAARSKGATVKAAPEYHTLEVGQQCAISLEGRSENGSRTVIYNYARRTEKKFTIKKANDNELQVTRIA